jgi:uncharacterized protein YjiS (DUF1127 family)
MGAGSSVVCLLGLASGGFASAGDFGAEQWAAVAYLALFGAALTFFLWVFALARTTPTNVTNTITLNPLSASIVASFLVGEPIGLSLIVGIAAVFTGILIASTGGRFGWRGAVGRVRQWLAEQHNRRTSASHLQLMNDAALRDIGLVREDVADDIDRASNCLRWGGPGAMRDTGPAGDDWRIR